ncbi:MAG: type II toxin-antitoxin system Phd/YefM family antitoxin [Gaiellales bacterium]
MARSLSISEARATLPGLVSAVESGEEIAITRHGRPVAVLVRPDALRVRRAEAALAAATRVDEAIVEGARSARPTKGVSTSRADELVAEVRAGRSAR